MLDDYQAVTNPDCHELLALFIERLSATLHLVVATRIHPPTRFRDDLLEMRDHLSHFFTRHRLSLPDLCNDP